MEEDDIEDLPSAAWLAVNRLVHSSASDPYIWLIGQHRANIWNPSIVLRVLASSGVTPECLFSLVPYYPLNVEAKCKVKFVYPVKWQMG